MVPYYRHLPLKLIIGLLLYIVGSFFLYTNVVLAAPFFASKEADFVYYLPTYFSLYLPMIALNTFFFFYHTENVKTKWYTALVYSVLVGGISVGSFVGVSYMALKTDINLSGSIFLYPFSILAIDVLFIISAIVSMVYVVVNFQNRLVKRTSSRSIKVREKIFGICMLTVSGFFFGDVLSGIRLFFQPPDSNLGLMLIIFMVFLYGAEEIILYVIYQALRVVNEDTAYIYYKNALYFFFLFYLLFNTVEVAAIMINPNFFIESMGPYLPMQKYFGVPFEMFLGTGLPLIPIIVSCYRFGKMKNEQKQKQGQNKN